MALNDHSSRAHALLSASSSARWLVCTPSAVAATMYPDQDTAYTREGTLAHEVAERVARCALDGIKYDWERCEDWSSEDVTPEMVRCAVAYADYIQELITDDSAVVLLEQRVDFSPWVPDGFGTADCIIIQGSRMDVVDYKYGQGVAVVAEENPQMKLYGLGALNDFGMVYNVQEVGLHIFQPRMNNVSSWSLQAAELLSWGEVAVAPTAALAAKGEGNYSTGPHCRFCPHAGSCPVLADDCGRLVCVPGTNSKVAIRELAPWQVANILFNEPMISAWLKAVKERALSGMLDGEEIPGFKVVAGRATRAWADDLEVGRVLEAAGFSREDYTKTETLSPAAMEKAIGKKKVAELLSGHILSNPGAPTVAPVSDKRKPFDRLAEARNDFNQ